MYIRTEYGVAVAMLGSALKSSCTCRTMAESNAVHTRRPAMRRATAAAAERIYREKFGAADGSVPATFEACHASALCAALLILSGHGLSDVTEAWAGQRAGRGCAERRTCVACAAVQSSVHVTDMYGSLLVLYQNS